MQMLFDGSDETPDVTGLGVVAGRVTLLPKTVRLPQMGWNTLELAPGSHLGTGLPDPAWLYFVHSYAPEPADPSVVAAWCDYGRRFAAAIEAGPVWATQFHPEKSGDSRDADAPELRRCRTESDRQLMDLYPSIDLRGGQGGSPGARRLQRADHVRRRSGRGRAPVRRRPGRGGSTWSISMPRSTAATRTWPLIEAICANVGRAGADRRRRAQRRRRGRTVRRRRGARRDRERGGRAPGGRRRS